MNTTAFYITLVTVEGIELGEYDEVASAFDNAFYIGHDFGALRRIHKADMVSLW